MQSRRFAAVVLALAVVLSSTVSVFSEERPKTPGQLIREAKAQIREVSIDDAKRMMDNKEKVIFLDIRDKEEYDKGHLPGAINMSRGLLDFHVSEIIEDQDAKIVVIWMFDKRSPLATRSLNVLGYRNAVNLRGGMKAWQEAGFPIVK